MSTFEYLSVFVSIVIGLAVVHVLSGVARMITSPRVRPYWLHLLWSFNLLYGLTLFWWFTFSWRTREVWGFGLFVFVVGFAMLQYFLSVVVLPIDPPEELDYRTYYYAKHRVIFSLWALLVVVDTADGVLKGPESLAALGAAYLPAQVGFFVLMIVAAVSRSEKVHAAIGVTWTATLFLPPFSSMYEVFSG